MTPSPEVAQSGLGETRRAERASTWSGLITAVALGAIVAVVANAVIALVARGLLGASSDFRPLTPPVFIALTVIGTAVGGLG